MIYTLTLNPAIDKTVVIPSFSPNTVNRIRDVRTDVGGKGINVSKCLSGLGCKSTAAAFWGGDAGDRGIRFLEECGIDSLAVRISGQTRTNLKIVDPERKQNTDINEPGPFISPQEQEELLEKLDCRIRAGDILILSGSIPGGIEPTVYRDLIRRYGEKGAKVFLDADGSCFREGITAAPYLIKPNIDELRAFFGTALSTGEEILAAARQLLDMGIREIVVSLGADGAMLVNSQGAYRAPGLRVPVKSTVGAGDSMVAALAYGIQEGIPAPDRLALAVAMSAASVMCSGTQIPDGGTVTELVRQVRIEEVF